MHRNKSFSLLVIALLLLPLLLTAQEKKQLTYEQAFNRAEPRLLGMLPRIEGWLDKENYLEYRMSFGRGGGQALYKVNAATGQENLWCDLAELGKSLPEGFVIDPRAEHDPD